MVSMLDTYEAATLMRAAEYPDSTHPLAAGRPTGDRWGPPVPRSAPASATTTCTR